MPNRGPLPPLTVLVVDDEHDTADSLAELLALYGYVARVAYDGGDAIRQAALDPPDVILLDVRMPRVDGYEVARVVREQAAGKCPVLVAVTGAGGAGDGALAVGGLFDLTFAKPVDPALLASVLKRFRRLRSPTGSATDSDPHSDGSDDGESGLPWHVPPRPSS